ncbi:MAG: UDP-N-acetylglucosamine 2-epimerase (non-hydrolyzing) [Pirellulaceae bacterium]
MPKLNIAIVAGARPNFVKIAPLLHAFASRDDATTTLIHTGQHYDKNLSDVFFDQLEIKRPEVSLGVGGGSHAQQTAKIMELIEPVLEAGLHGQQFDRLIVVGDVNSTMAAAVAATKLHIPVAHVEAGLRSFDRSMPEEINRLITDAISDQLLVSEPSGVENLLREGHSKDSIRLVGNLMIDTLMGLRAKAQATSVLDDHGLVSGNYGVVTLHRPSNVDNKETLAGILEVLAEVSEHMPLAFPIHPRTAGRIEAFGLQPLLEQAKQIVKMPPIGYLEFLALTSSSKVIVTDSGGLQEESTALQIPCLTMRENTERPITVTDGSSTLVGSDAAALREQLQRVIDGNYPTGTCPALWDGKAASRIVSAVMG